MNLTEECYRMTEDFPKNEEFGLKSQMRRAAVSIPSNIAEGHTRQHTNEFVQMLSIALGSLSELETQFELSRRFKYITEENIGRLSFSCRKIGKMLNGLKSAVSKRRAER